MVEDDHVRSQCSHFPADLLQLSFTDQGRRVRRGRGLKGRADHLRPGASGQLPQLLRFVLIRIRIRIRRRSNVATPPARFPAYQKGFLSRLTGRTTPFHLLPSEDEPDTPPLPRGRTTVEMACLNMSCSW